MKPMTYLTSEEVVLLINYVHEQVSELSKGDFEANKQEMANMHCLAAKLINLNTVHD